MPGRSCPKCQVGLRTLGIEGVAVDLCPACRGIWFDRGELEAATGATLPLRPDQEVLHRATRTRYVCPRCKVSLYERPFLSGSGIKIDECPGCAGIWLDRGEFSAIKYLLKSKGRELRREGCTRKEARQEVGHYVDGDSAGLAIFQYLTGLPVEADVPQTVFSPAVTTLIGINVIVLLLTILSGNFEGWVKVLGAIPAQISSFSRLHTLFTSMFMHGGLLHLFGNMYFLWVTGDNLEERFGPIRFLGFYLLAGLVADFAQVMSNPSSQIPTVGASGAISGMMGAYMVLFPKNRFLMRWLVYFRPVQFEWPAYAYFLFWMALQVLYASLGVGGVGWFAHSGGFACGVAVALAVRLGGARQVGGHENE